MRGWKSLKVVESITIKEGLRDSKCATLYGKVDKEQKKRVGKKRNVGSIVKLIWSYRYEGTLRRKCKIVAESKGETKTKDVI